MPDGIVSISRRFLQQAALGRVGPANVHKGCARKFWTHPFTKKTLTFPIFCVIMRNVIIPAGSCHNSLCLLPLHALYSSDFIGGLICKGARNNASHVT